MFNYTKEIILNDIDNVVIGTGADSSHNGLAVGEFAVKRAGNYKFADIVDKKVYKAAGVAGAKGKAKITVGSNLTNGQLCRFSMFISTPGTEFVEYAMPNWHEFGKPVIAEFKAGADVNATAANLAASLKLALNEDNKLYNVTYTASTAYVFIELAESWMDLKDYVFEKETTVSGEVETWSTATEFTFLMDGTSSTVVPVAEFGTAKWIVENLRFPSYPNLRYTPLYADEAPVAGTIYNQYSFQYRVKRSVPGGLCSVGQEIDSVTTHVFYVPVANAAAFEQEFLDGGCEIENKDITLSKQTVTVSSSTTTATFTVTPTDATVTSTDASVATVVNNSGTVTVTRAGAGSCYIKVVSGSAEAYVKVTSE